MTVTMPMKIDRMASVQIDAVRRVLRAVEHPEVGGDFFVLAHRVGHASARVDARERRADERQEHRERLDEHERPPCAVGAEEPRAHDDHHVAEGRARGSRVGQRVPLVQEVVRREVLDQVAKRALDREREEHRLGDVPLGVLGLLTHRRDRLESDQDEDRDARLDEHVREAVRRDDRPRGLVELEVRSQVLRMVGVDRIHA